MATSRVSPVRPPVHLVPSHNRTIDPLLGNLSPESTLKALSSTDAVPKNEQAARDILSKSISQVSPAERALGIRAAIAAQSLSFWYKEIQAWDWPKRVDVHLGKGFIPPSTTAELASSEPEFWGSLPAAVVLEHEKRIEEIRDGMESLNVDELKEHVLNAHIPSRSRPSSSNSTISVPPPLSYVQLSDFTAVITATILRALPLLSRLNSLLSTWDVRLLVLRQVPGLLWSLRIARSELNSALDSLKLRSTPTEKDALYSRTNYHAKRAELETSVLSAGRRMDRMLDALEGRDDSLPESWIDDLEAIESDFGSWVMEAEKRTVANEWQRMEDTTKKPEKQEAMQASSSPLSDNPSGMEPALNGPEPICTTGRSPPMETIQEEPISPVESLAVDADKGDQTATISNIDTPPVTAETPETSILENSSLILETVAENTKTHPSEPEKAAVEVMKNDPSTRDAQELVLGTSAHDMSRGDSPFIMEKEEVSTPALTEDATVFPSFQDMNSQQQAIHDRLNSEQLPPSPERNISRRDQLPPLLIKPPSSSSLPETGEQTSHYLTLQDNIDNSSTQKLMNAAENSPSMNEMSSMGQADSENPDNATNTADRSTQSSPAPTASKVVALALATTKPSIQIPDSVVVKRVESSLSRPTSPVQLSPKPSVISSNGQGPAASGQEARSPRKPLESPIKLSKSRPGRLELSKDDGKPHARRTSNASAGSFSDYPSLISSPEMREPLTSSSNGTPRFLKTPPQFQPDYEPPRPVPSTSDHTLREDRLFRLPSPMASPRTAVQHNRNLSLPLQRFINERLELDFENETEIGMGNPTSSKRAVGSFATSKSQNKQQSMPPRPHGDRWSAPNNKSRGQRLNSREDNYTPAWHKSSEETPNTQEQNPDAFVKNAVHKVVSTEPALHLTTTRLRKQLTAHPSLESIGAYKSKPQVEGISASSNTAKPSSRSSTPSSQFRKPKDHLDEKISSILTTLPTRIHLVSAEEREHDESAASLSLLSKARERFRSMSPQGTASRSDTPTPSLTLTPAVSRRRHSHAYGPEESSVKLYHLHQGGKSAPTKLFVRSVGEKGERVMVRVGGGWADLAEYLREYAIHHGHRHVSETPRVEVQGLSSRESTPSYSPPGSRLLPASNGRSTPSRPRSVISNRPSSSLAVRKTRRASNVSDMTDFRAVSAGEALNMSLSPKSIVSSRRRLSVSSNTSTGTTSCVSEIRHGSYSYSPSTTVGGGSSHSIPLGLAGPKPRPRHVSMTPESEAWVEDVLGQARRSSSLRPFTYGLPPPEQEQPAVKTSILPKSRSISDLGTAGSSKRVALRGLGNR
ncbi:hypothetical protein EYZ11_000910 [Aspergillus tanneri]|uniref:GAR domain-containing protein n=1 Tax=Aspergillus tanneri TaxID=1220188 RepID=A0A4S3JW70_9EURO|nr:hypothetical protein EYZ11_000910 [Aspergillus tanneri]